MDSHPTDTHRLEEVSESQRHDGIYAQQRARKRRALTPDDWERFDRVSVPKHPYHASVIWLGDIRGKRVLDVGCGDGWFSILLAKRGAIVSGFDISAEGVLAAQEWAEANGVAGSCSFVTGSIYDIPYPENSFDIVAGQSILHHATDKTKVASELARVLRPGGLGVFHEPFGDSLALEWVRRMVPVPSQAPDDPGQWKQQIKYAELMPFRRYFEVGVHEFEFLTRLERVITAKKFTDFLRSVDHAMLKHLPFLRRFARAVVITIKKEGPATAMPA